MGALMRFRCHLKTAIYCALVGIATLTFIFPDALGKRKPASRYIIDYTCTETDAKRTHNAGLSFFSGHSSTVAYTAVCCVIYLQSRLRTSALIRGAIQLALVAVALAVCLSRITDGFHHPTDVLAGIVVGGFDAREESHSGTKTVMTALKTLRLNPSAILINFIGLYAVGFLIVLIPEGFGVRQRGFYCDDTSIQHPFYDHTIPMGKMTLVILALFFIIPLFTEFLVARSESAGVAYHWWNFSVPSFIVQTLLLFGYSHIGFVFQVALTQWAKYGFGRLRPHFMDVCKPIGYVCTESNQYITNYTCSGSNTHQVYETRLSFFSGHSSTAIYAAVFIAIYLESRLAPRNLLASARRVVQGSIIVLALTVCATRVTDNFHHPSDVAVGIAFGVIVAMVTVSSVAGLCSYSLKPVRQPKGRTIFARFISRGNGMD